MPDQADARAQAEALVDDYERVISDAVLEREYLIEAILAYGTAREAAGRERAVQALARVRRMRPGNICSEETNCTHARCCFHSGISYAADVIEEALRTPAPGAGTPWSDAPMDHTPAERAAGRCGAEVGGDLEQALTAKELTHSSRHYDEDGAIPMETCPDEACRLTVLVRAALAAPAPGREGAR